MMKFVGAVLVGGLIASSSAAMAMDDVAFMQSLGPHPYGHENACTGPGADPDGMVCGRQAEAISFCVQKLHLSVKTCFTRADEDAKAHGEWLAKGYAKH